MRARIFALFNKSKSSATIRADSSSIKECSALDGLCDEDGYLVPRTAEYLLSIERRAVLVDRIWEQTSVSKASFERLYYQPIKRYAELVQELPASESHHHSYIGGMLDHGLELVLYSLRLRQGYLLPIGAPPEDQAKHSDAWTAGTAYGGLLHDIGKIFCDIRIETKSGTLWYPWQGPLKESYRFKYIPGRDYNLHNASATLLCHQVLGTEVMDWLAKNPPLWGSLLYLLSGNYSEAGALGEIVSKADRTSSALSIGANPEKALKAPPTSLQSHLIRGLRQLLKDEEHLLKLNAPGASGWLTQDGLWLVSKVVADKLRSFLLAQGVDKVPSKNSSLFDELQSHRLIEPNADGNAIWRATVSDGNWKQEFTFLRVKPSLIWGSEEYPSAFTGSITLAVKEAPTTEEAETTALKPASPSSSGGDVSSKQPQQAQPVKYQAEPVTHQIEPQQHKHSANLDGDDGISDLIAIMDMGNNKANKEDHAPWEEQAYSAPEPQTFKTSPEDEIPFEKITSQADKAINSKPAQGEQQTTSNPLPEKKPSSASAKKANKPIDKVKAFSAKLNDDNLGQSFIDWLKYSINKRSIYINDSRAQVHIVDGKVFLVTPGIFQRFASEFPEVQKLNSDPKIKDWHWVQKAFERLQLHIKRQDDLNIWECSVRGPRVKGNNLNGYMLPLEILFNFEPQNNPFVTIKQLIK